MSLINQMLRDLEARRAAEANQQSGVFRGLTTSLTRSHRPLLLGVVAVVVTAAVAVGGTWYWTRHQGTTVPATAANTTVVVSNPVTMKAPPAAAQTPSIKTPLDHSALAPQAAVPRPTAATLAVQEPAKAEPSPKGATPTRVMSAPRAATPTERRQLEIVPRAPSGQQRAAQLYQEAVALLRDRRPADAEAKLQAALRAEPAYWQASEALAVMLINAGRIIEAEAVVETARKHNSSRPTLELLAARIHVAHGDIAGAVNVLEKGLAFSGGRPDYVALLAALYQKQGRHRESAAAYERVVALEPGDASAWTGLGISDEALGKTAAALDAYTRALSGQLPAALRDYAENRRKALQARQAH